MTDNPVKIRQIIQCAAGWRVGYIFHGADGKVAVFEGNVRWAWEEIPCWALTEDGDIEPMVRGDRGLILASEWTEHPRNDYSIMSPSEREEEE